ncbi:MAG: hypothetical protein IT445_12560 [Phycisphaeraceae bacterium]|nr:hypothetical protein [Phycisphaeraceae bacterium]
MTSKQVMLTLIAVALLSGASGCSELMVRRPQAQPPLETPYAERQLWAVAPIRNESGSSYADGYRMADHLSRQLESVARIDALPVNRVIAAMDVLQMPAVASPEDVRRLMQTLGVDGLIVGTIAAYEPYDPPKIGLAVELYLDPLRPMPKVIDERALTRAAVDQQTRPIVPPRGRGPDSAVSAFYDAADPGMRSLLEVYAAGRGESDNDAISSALYRSSMDLFSEFVAHLAVARLLAGEQDRLADNAPTAAGEP